LTDETRAALDEVERLIRDQLEEAMQSRLAMIKNHDKTGITMSRSYAHGLMSALHSLLIVRYAAERGWPLIADAASDSAEE